MNELINRIATGRTTIDDADAVRAMVAALLDSLAFAAWCAKHAHDEETKTRAAALRSSTADALDSTMWLSRAWQKGWSPPSNTSSETASP